MYLHPDECFKFFTTVTSDENMEQESKFHSDPPFLFNKPCNYYPTTDRSHFSC